MRQVIRQLALGAVAGLPAAALAWFGNRTPHLVSVLPDAVTGIVLLGAILIAARMERDRTEDGSAGAFMRTSLVIGAGAGVVLGIAVLGAGLVLLSPGATSRVGLFGFAVALASALICGAFAGYLLRSRPHTRKSAVQ